MKQVLLMLILAIIPPAYALQTAGNTVTLTDEEVIQCSSNGGCLLVPREVVLRYIASEIEKGTKSCRKGSI